ncbi:MAG: PQQ-like beta-propeller repeat protein [Proteobacteria bacterium]|nr:PQQ-like beta-propeller repeat protein [Pseudomonadota bacterium]
MNKLTAIILFAAACLTGCAGASNFSAQKASAPKSAQYMLELDWDYPLTPGKQNYLGANPLELGAVTSVNGYTYVASSLGKVLAIDDATAKPRWTRSFDMPVTAGPVITSKGVFIALGDGAVIKLNPKTGEIIWRYEAGVAVEKSIAVKDNLVACVNANNRVFLIDEETGSLKWRKERPKSQEFSMYGQSAPLIDNGIVYTGFSDGFLVAYAAANGTAIWSRELAPNARFKDLDVHPVRVDDKLYVATSSGGLYALNIETGQTIWQRDIYGISSIRAFQDSLYISSQSGIFRIKRDTGDTIWQNVIQKEALISEIALGKNYIYASVQKYGLVILDRAGGALLHVIDMGSDFTAAPELQPGALTAFSNRSTIYRFIVDDIPL